MRTTAAKPPSTAARWRTAALALTICLGGCAVVQAPPASVTAEQGRTPAYNRPYAVGGRWYTPRAQPGYDAVGLASWYDYQTPGRRTADGEPYEAYALSAAHPTLPIPSWLEVTNLSNGRRARVRLNDRGPFHGGRILDVSRAAADQLGFRRSGVARVRVRYLGPADPLGREPAEVAAAAPLAGFDPRAEVAADAAFSEDTP